MSNSILRLWHDDPLLESHLQFKSFISILHGFTLLGHGMLNLQFIVFNAHSATHRHKLNSWQFPIYAMQLHNMEILFRKKNNSPARGWYLCQTIKGEKICSKRNKNARKCQWAWAIAIWDGLTLVHRAYFYLNRNSCFYVCAVPMKVQCHRHECALRGFARAANQQLIKR